MGLRLEPYTSAHVPAVRSFNARIAAAVPYSFGTNPWDRDTSQPPSVWVETLLAMDGEEVRGGVMLEHQRFRVGDADREVVNIQLPLSEGVADKKYAYEGMWILKS